MPALIPVRFGRERLRLGEAPIPMAAYALVDDEDALLVGDYDWRYTTLGGTGYAVASSRPYASMHGLIASAPRGMVVHHVNGDGLDNRRANLKICSRAAHNREPHPWRRPGHPTISHERRAALYGEEG